MYWFLCKTASLHRLLPLPSAALAWLTVSSKPSHRCTPQAAAHSSMLPMSCSVFSSTYVYPQQLLSTCCYCYCYYTDYHIYLFFVLGHCTFYTISSEFFLATYFELKTESRNRYHIHLSRWNKVDWRRILYRNIFD